MDPRQTRGYLNNNPGNIDRAAPPYWDGEIRDVNDPRLTAFQRKELVEGRFCVFTRAHYGLRALAKNLLACHDRLGDSTVPQYIGHWAPPSDNNNTAAYIAAVCAEAGVSLYDVINIRDRRVLKAVMHGIVRVECAGVPYSDDQFDEAITAAGVR